MTVYFVQLVKPWKGKRQYMFGSVEAIYHAIPWQQIGITKRKLRDIEKLCQKGEFCNDQVCINQYQVSRMPKSKNKKEAIQTLR